MTKAQKEQYVLLLYKQDKTREIAERANMVFRDIGVITDKFKTEVERDAGHINDQEIDNKANSKESIALDISANLVHAIYREYRELKGMHKSNVLYGEKKDSLPSFLKLHT